MAYTIARSAGKHATFDSPTLMATDSDHAASGGSKAEPGHTVPAVQIVSLLDDDPRLLIGAGAIASHTAQEAGLSQTAQEYLVTATKEACAEIFALAPPDLESPASATLTASRFPDRIEIAIELSVDSANAHSRKAVPADGKHGNKQVDDRLVDQVHREMRDGRPSVVLVKYYRPVKSKA